MTIVGLLAKSDSSAQELGIDFNAALPTLLIQQVYSVHMRYYTSAGKIRAGICYQAHELSGTEETDDPWDEWYTICLEADSMSELQVDLTNALSEALTTANKVPVTCAAAHNGDNGKHCALVVLGDKSITGSIDYSSCEFVKADNPSDLDDAVGDVVTQAEKQLSGEDAYIADIAYYYGNSMHRALVVGGFYPQTQEPPSKGAGGGSAGGGASESGDDSGQGATL